MVLSFPNNPLPSSEALDVIQTLRSTTYWRIVDYPGNLMENVWKHARSRNFGRSQVYDTRIALTLLHHGVTTVATRNTSHFSDFGLTLVNPID